MITNLDRASVLVEALPYIQQYTGKIVVVKYGGNAMTNDELKLSVMRDIVLLSIVGLKPVLIHGGGPEISSMLKRVGKQSEFVNGLRVTDAETAEIVQMVLAGKINKSLVALIQNIGGNAVGLSGMDGGLIKCEVKDPQLGFVGKITDINEKPVRDLLDAGYIPVISTVGYDGDGNVYNINADTAAAAIAGKLGAECLYCMTDIAGLLRDKDDPSTLIPYLTLADTRRLTEEGVISGGMIPKVECCVNAVEWGVRKAIILDGRVPHSILMELFTDEGIGTMFARKGTI